MSDRWTDRSSSDPDLHAETGSEEAIDSIEEFAFPASFAQQRLWFLDQLEPGQAVYNVPFTGRFQGRLDVAALEESINEIIWRHESLRTTFAYEEGELLQIVVTSLSLSIAQVDLEGCPQAEREGKLIELASAEVMTPFDLERGPLLRAKLIRLEEQDHVLLLTLHHIISDGWSIGVLMQELVACYHAFSAGQEPALPDLPIQYADYAHWQKEWLEGEVLETQMSYWREQLGGDLPAMQLPFDYKRPPTQTNRGALERFALPTALTSELKALSQRRGLTLFMTLLGAFQLLLARYSGQTDVAVGSPIAGRNRTELEGLIGFFVNTLVLRTDLSGDPTLDELLERVKEVTLSAYAHQDVPFEKLVGELLPERDRSVSPFFQALFVLQNSQTGKVELPGLTISPFVVDSTAAKFDLELSMEERDGQLFGTLIYNADLFAASTIARLIGHYQRLLAGIVQQPERKISDLPLLTEQERQQQVVVWNDTATAYPEASIHQLFTEQAARTPDAVALVYGEQQLTYRQLNARANQLAHHLQQQGVGAETFVGIATERSLELIVGLLAILKAGGVYVPINPNDPVERVLYQLEDANIHTLLTKREWAEQLPPHPAQVVLFDRDAEQIGSQSETEPSSAITPDHLAYVVYTSGSTGQPKGVCVPHRGVVRLVKETDYVSFSPDEVFLQFAPVAFDASTFEIWGSLLNGARLIICPAGQLSLSELRDVICEHQISTLWLTTGLFHQMVDEHLDDLRGVRQLLAGGDTLSVTHVKKVVERLPNCQLINCYGPTENTTFTTYYPVTAASELDGSVPIGRPIANTTVYVLDRHLQPVPVGVAGELYIGGAGLAREYLNQPELTAQTFIPSPFAEGERLYKTGDLVRYLPDGTIDFLGRIDSQVKIRGFRIELGEVEAMIGQHPAVLDSYAMVREDAPGDKRLVAYLVAQEQMEVERSELRAFLKERLPEYMVPSAFMQLDELPLNQNGKVDQRKLPAPDAAQFGGDSPYVAPRTALEEQVAAIWADVLRVPQVSMLDNFFDLGGHSLLATQVVSRLQAECGVEIQLRALFETSSAEELAARIEQMQLGEQRAVATPIASVDRSAPLPLSFAQQRLWVVDRLLPGTAVYNMPFAVRLQGALRQVELERSINEIIRRHEALRTHFAEVDDQPVQVIAAPVWQSLPVVNLQMLSAEEQEVEVRRQVQAEADRPFDLLTGPLVRFALLQLQEAEHVLILNMHHIISDGWSMGVFINEFATLYRSYAAGEESPLPELAIQYVDYAAWQRDALEGEALEEQLAYWKEQLGGELPVLQLPTDRPRPPVQTYVGAIKHFTVEPELTAVLQQLSQRHGVTLFMTLLGAFQAFLSRYSGQVDISVGTSIAGRTRRETEELIGFFVNTQVLRTDLSGQPTFVELLGRVKEVALGAYAHQYVPFERLVEELQPERDLSRSPLFQVLFALQNAPMSAIELPELTIQPVEYESQIAKFDLSLLMTEADGSLHASFEYNTDLFDLVTVERMIEHFQTLLRSIAAQPEQRITRLQMLSDAEFQQVVVEWNRTDVAFPDQLCLHQLFEQQVERAPERVAAIFGEQEITYAELEAQSNRLAHRLIELGVGPDVPVGLCMDRSLEMVVALLGILKAGGAYLPLDTEAPTARIAQVLTDAQAPICLTQSHLRERLPDDVAVYLSLDPTAEDAVRLGSYRATAPQVAVTPDHLVSIYYTSGSTGRPKGVASTHRGWVNRMVWMQRHYRLEAQESVLQKTTLTFDDAACEFYWPLMVGARIALMEPGLHKDPRAILDAAIRYQVAFTTFVPSMLALVVDTITADDREKLRCLRHVGSSGEALRANLVRQFRERVGCQLHNTWGATEVSIDSTVHVCTEADESGAEIVSVGRPIDNNRCYVLDAHLQPVPIGVPGELYLGGIGLARNYLNNPERTAESFLPNPFVPGEQLYKTGDRGYFRRDGAIQFLGRIDNQLKIRGMRVELGEIENVLSQHDAVKEAVVIAREEMPGDKRLVAYLVAHPSAEVDRHLLRSFLKERLPEHMVPPEYMLLEAMPLNANGKVDRRALPAPDRSQLAQDSSYVAPRTPVEEMVAAIWADVLNSPQVGAADNFFELGGHSLLATQVMSRLNRAFGLQIPLRALFENATVESLAGAVAETLQREEGALTPAIEKADRNGPLPLSFAQQRLWLVERLLPGTAVYNMPYAVRLQGALDLQVLERTINSILDRHESLRTSFVEREGQPLQAIAAPVWQSLPVQSLQGLTAEQQAREVERLVQAEAERPFDLLAGSLVRFSLLELDASDHVLLLNMHHIVSDGWSMGVFIQEFAALYEAYGAGLPSPLPELAIQYADYAVWQRNWLSGDVLQAQLDYWKEQLGGELPALQLPTDRPRPPVQTHVGALAPFAVASEVTEALKRIGQRQGSTLFMTLLSAFQTLLFRYSGQEEIIVGTPIAGRNAQETEALIGFFVNTLVLRTDLSGDPTFAELLDRVREVALGAYAHQDLPFEKLVEELQPERDRSRSPLFQVFFALQNAPVGAIDLTGLTIQPVDYESKIAKFDLSLSMHEDEAGLRGSFEYNTDLFDAFTIERMIGHFQQLLHSIAASAEQRVSALPMLTEQERQHLLVELEADLPESDAIIHRLFEAQVARTPDAVAVQFAGQSLTYRELNGRANRLAHHLRELGVGPDVMVTLFVERSADLVIGLLGILKAGGAYVPLDTAYPEERISLILEDSEAAIMVTQSHLLDRLPVSPASVVRLDADLERLASYSESNLTHEVAPRDLAYMIYTSGSTGRPKAVMVEHRNLVSTIMAAQDQFAFAEADVFPWIASVAFDIALFELLNPLLVGGRSEVLTKEQVLDVSRLLTDLERYTMIHTVPSLMRQIVQTIEEQQRPSECYDRLRTIFIGGDAVPPDLLQAMHRVFRQAKVQVLYGPTEGTIICSSYHVPRERALDKMVIGTKLANANLRVCDASGQAVPVGVSGELYIGGAGVSRGYFRRADLTEEKYVTREGKRWYRTGDLVRRLPDGTLEFLGRIDNQVKIRGFRIELGEIEKLLCQLAEVREAVVDVQEPTPSDKRLVAYVVYESGQTLTIGELRSHLKARVPDYMVPSAFAVLEALPLNQNGKVDRRALPAPDMSELDGAYVAPNTAAEELVASIWEEVLQAERIGIHDNFFERGGHSLLATQVISRIEEAFGVDVPLRHLFELPTVAALAEQVQALQAAGRGRQVPPLLQAERVGPMPLSFAQQRLWLIDQLQPGSAVYNMPFVVRLEGELDVEALERSLEEIIARHEALRTTFVEGPAEPLQVIAAPDRLSLAVRDLSSLPAEEREATARQLAQEEVAASFDLSAGPLIRCSLLKLAEQEHLLVLNMHHIVSDGWSTGVFLREFAALYAAFADGRPSPLPALAIQYADYAVWQRNWLQGSALEEQLSYWKERLGGDLPALQLPTDRPRPSVQTHRGAVVSAELSPELARALQALSKRQGVTLFMTLLAAFQTMLVRYTGQEDIAVGTPIAGRNAKETEELIGFFVNTLVMRTDLSGEPTFREVLKRVREVALGAYANQDVPFERLVEELQPPRDTSRTPLFQTMFVLQNDALPAVEVEGLLIEPLDISNETAKFDLTLFVQGEQDELVAMFEYNTDLFEASTARRMIDHFHNLLHEIAADPDRSISRYSLLAERERDTLLLEWNDTKREHGEEKTFAQLFEAQVEKTPDAVAVELSAESWTYRELNEQANRLAHLLKRYGVGPDVIVGIFLDRSLAMMAAFLAVFKAGGAYLPLDPSTPPERMSFLLQDAGAALVLTTSTLGGRVPASDLPQIVLDGQADLIAGQPADNLAPAAEPGHLAYLIYTSGSTGLPKGTMIEQRGLTNYLLWAVDAYRLQEGAGAIVHSSVAFDMPITSLFPPLLTGKKVVFTPQEASGVEALCQLLLTRQDFSLVKLTPAHLQLLNRELEGEDWQGLARALVIGGEALLPEQVAPWQERAPETRLINEYGPTETVVGCCVHEVSEADRGGAIPIGRPIANMAMYILNAQQQPVPIGVVGEIYIGGHGVARGYRNREELQAERFLPDPFRAEEAAKMYRTGDLASYRADGAIEYVGRIDSQVKIRGYRIELGEVEAALYQHPAVREALVIDREDVPGNRRLVAYLVAGEKPVAGREIRAFLKRFLSEYMIPSDFVWLEEIPLTANGKVDHKALPTPSADLEREERETAPRDRLEMQLVRIWEAVLGRSNIGVRDNFFELGGHSLLALQVIKEIEARLEQKVSLTTLIQSGTIEQLAALLRDGEASDHRVPTLLPLRANGTQRPLFLVHPIGGHATSYVELAKALGEDQPVYALQSPGLEGECEPLDRIADMAAHYLAEIRAVQPVGPYLLGGWSFGGAVAYEMAQQLRASGEEVALLALLDSAVPKLNRSTEAELAEGALALQFAADLAGRFGIDVTPLAEEFAEKGAEETLDAVLELAQRHHVLALSFERTDLKRLFDVFRANAVAYQQYEPQPYDREVVLFRAEAGPSALIEDQSLGYGELVQEVDVHVMSGDHFTLLQMPNVTQLASRLQTVLERVKKTETTS